MNENIEFLRDIYTQEEIRAFVNAATDAALAFAVNWISLDPYTSTGMDELIKKIYSMLDLEN